MTDAARPSPGATETIAAVLGAHRFLRGHIRQMQHGEEGRVVLCACLLEFDNHDAHRLHQAKEVLASEAVAALVAERDRLHEELRNATAEIENRRAAYRGMNDALHRCLQHVLDH